MSVFSFGAAEPARATRPWIYDGSMGSTSMAACWGVMLTARSLRRELGLESILEWARWGRVLTAILPS